jgi:hypothetical protein
MSASPPPEEKNKADAEARAKELAEQAALPYKWDQTIKDLDITRARSPSLTFVASCPVCK